MCLFSLYICLCISLTNVCNRRVCVHECVREYKNLETENHKIERATLEFISNTYKGRTKKA